MRASEYLRMKFQHDRHLALVAQNGFRGTMQAAMGVASDIYSGLERASWYSSCFIPGYNNVCQELKAEEVRSLYSMLSIYRHRDVIQHMLYLYFKKLCEDIKEGSPKGSARELVKSVAGFASNMAAAKGTRYAFASALSEALAQSGFLSKIVVERLSGQMPKAVFLLQFFGMQQKAALAARALKAIDPEYYWALYHAKLEMLYYFAEPLLADLIKKVKSSAFTDLDKLTDYIREKYNV
jgi:hypothetical protein